METLGSMVAARHAKRCDCNQPPHLFGVARRHAPARNAFQGLRQTGAFTTLAPVQ
jgi:hypothetical protein